MNTTKLQALADHLNSGDTKLGWDFDRYFVPNGNCGCAIGEYGFWSGNEELIGFLEEYPRNMGRAAKQIEDFIKKDFDLTQDQYDFLFTPLYDRKGYFTHKASREEIANGILFLIKNDGEVLVRDDDEIKNHVDYGEELSNKV